MITRHTLSKGTDTRHTHLQRGRTRSRDRHTFKGDKHETDTLSKGTDMITRQTLFQRDGHDHETDTLSKGTNTRQTHIQRGQT